MYKWHDLRKDPNDLPCNGHYLVCMVEHGYYWYRCMWIIDGKWRPDDQYEFVDSDTIEAWKAIEPFRGDTDGPDDAV